MSNIPNVSKARQMGALRILMAAAKRLILKKREAEQQIFKDK